MVYVIKWLKEGNAFVRLHDDGVRFGEATLEYATRFLKISEAINAIVVRTDNTRDTWRAEAKLTIVGVKEVTTPRFEEVAI